ncbi:ABC transporter ATP-binding protein/permease [Flavonifractor sp. DFI.6.63]|mgnify:FL=1|uniref:ABC transporter ATP-binding protein n=1 Tax=Flavonifractor sp. DFI.6.63 TaxID=2963704 RepID=UPI0021092863|nr:ABC transporter ATP-binding protein [Flavonifractor sp. DFI.6.63]MCQ5027919.1 ABC transporter ATP-binding protein/permease [Flavonifractor sp. DFI.6.63]MDU2195035.1 ABC transporter ATP-binding protein [Clostridiales bacterium]
MTQRQTQQRPMHGPGGGPRGGYQKPKDMKKTIRRLLTYLTRHKLALAGVFLCLLVSVGSNLGGSYLLRPIINNFIYSGGRDFAGLALSLLQLLGIYAVGAAASYAQSAAMVRLAQRGVNKLRRDLFDKLQALPLSYFDRHPHGELMSRFTNDADNVQTALEQSLVSLISSALMFVGLVVIMLATNPLLFLITVVVLALTLFLFSRLGGKSRNYYRQQQATLGDMNGNIQEMIEGLRVVKAFTHERAAKEEFQRRNTAYRDAATRANFYSNAIMPVSNNLMNISYALTAAFGGLMSILTGFDLGGLVIYLNYSKQIGQPLNQISMQLTNVLSALAGAERMFEVMDTAPEADEGRITLVPAVLDPAGRLAERTDAGRGGMWAWKTPKNAGLALVPAAEGPGGTLTELDAPAPGCRWAWRYPGPDGAPSLHQIRGAVRSVDTEDCWLTELRGAVRFTDVDFSYVPGKPILKQVNVYANPGQKIAFVGSTGAGKTTITNLINRFYEIDSGLITYDGIDVRAIRKEDLRRSLGAVLQDTHLFTGTILDNIRYGRLDATDEECVAAAKSANAHSFIRRLPQGYDTPVSGDGGNLSQGQRQLLAIARAAVADPPVMILDEATSSIDTRTERHIERGMDALMEHRTVFVIAHRLSTVRNANCIVVIERGAIEEKGDHAQLLEHRGRYYQLYTGQFTLS